MKIKWRKSGMSAQDAYVGDVHVATVVKTGSHLDDYPWDWYFTDAAKSFGLSGAAVADTLRSAKSTIAYLIESSSAQ